MVSWTMRTARSLSSAGCWCPDPCLGVCCFDADMGYILPKNAASIKPRAVHAPFRNSGSNSLSALSATVCYGLAPALLYRYVVVVDPGSSSRFVYQTLVGSL